MATSTGPDSGLESRLRGMILSNSLASKDDGQMSNGSDASGSATGLINSAHPHRDCHQFDGTGKMVQPNSIKRSLNQAQRMQSSSQPSVPAHPQAQPGPTHHSAQRLQSATFASPSSSQQQHELPLLYQGQVPGEAKHPDGTHVVMWMAHSAYPRVPQHRVYTWRPKQVNGTLHPPNKPAPLSPAELKAQSDHLDHWCNTTVPSFEIEPSDLMEKETFRINIEQVCRQVVSDHEATQNPGREFRPDTVELKCFGSLSSGFATKSADMDLGLFSPLSLVQPDVPGSPIPRLLEKAFLEMGLGARLLSKARVPIIKLCQTPPEQLRLAMLAERERWDKGIEEDVEVFESQEDNPDSDEDAQQTQPRSDPGGAEGRPPQSHGKVVDASDHKSDSPKLPWERLRQGNSNLETYYENARVCLRKAGGHEITQANASKLTNHEYDILNAVCLAFVDGLADGKLRERLLGFRSLRRRDLSPPTRNRRSLVGVYGQVKTESLLMSRESRKIYDGNIVSEPQAATALQLWHELQDQPSYGLNPLDFNRDLWLTYDELRKLPSVRLEALSQDHNETITAYAGRAETLLSALYQYTRSGHKEQVRQVVLHRYVDGMQNVSIRTQVRQFLEARHVYLPSLRAVMRRQESLQLACDFETALNKRLYRLKSVPIIQAYIDLLRSPLVVSPQPRQSMPDHVVPMHQPLLNEIRQLVQPSDLLNNTRHPFREDALEIPKSGVGVQCDINFSAHLALHNTLLLRCYNHTDRRVRPMVLFVKHWANIRGINTPYRGTLSSYGYVLMVLHYLVNIADPFVCPNLQKLAPELPPGSHMSAEEIDKTFYLQGRNVRFWRNEEEIRRFADENAINANTESVGQLLRGFFDYYAHNAFMASLPHRRGFEWVCDVLSLRTQGGILSKTEKGWLGAKTVLEVQPTGAMPPNPHASAPSRLGNGLGPMGGAGSSTATAPKAKEVRHRYLVAIEDPFELEHNVARTVTQDGIVAIRDEFRRAWRIIQSAGKGQALEDLLQPAVVVDPKQERTSKQDRARVEALLRRLHGDLPPPPARGYGRH